MKDPKKEIFLENYNDIWSLVLYVSIKGEASPYNGDEAYWLSRESKTASTKAIKGILMKKQKGNCTICKFQMVPGLQELEIDHIIPKKENGSNQITNLQLLHKGCHSIKTAAERKRWAAKS